MSRLSNDANTSKQFKTPFGKGTEVPISIFLDTLLPPLRSGIDLDTLVHHKSDKGRAKLPITKDGQLWGYSAKKPSEIKGPTGIAFKSLQTCAWRISKAVIGVEQIHKFKNHQRVKRRPKEEEDELPDAYLLLRSRDTGPIDWPSIAVPGAYEKSSPETSEATVTKITELMCKCMVRDPRRRFTYGFTVEDTSMCLWYCDRSQILASEPFNFISDWRTLFHFILSIVYAEPREVGFDPTMTLVKQDDEPARYDILVRSEAGEEQIYRTLELLHDQGAEYLVGRGTRVWKAVKIENGEEVGDPVVLKDAWVDHHREREGSINARVRESAIHSTHRGLFDMGLLTILSHGDVFVAGVQDRTPLLVQDDRRIGDVTVGGHDTVATDERGDVESATQEGASGNYIASGHDGFTVQEQAPGDDIVGDRGVTAADKHLNDDPANSQLLYQVHYRIVYKEVGRPLGTLTSLYSIFKALREVTYNLQAMYECGWVHGDISVGNILYFDKWAKITDLEYAAQKDELQRHDRVGTRYFTAEEVRQHRYIFRPEPTFRSRAAENATPPSPPEDTGSVTPLTGKRRTRGAEVRHANKPVFRYNPLHDLESLWWVAVYFLVTRDVTSIGGELPAERPTSDINAQRQWAEDIFWIGGDHRWLIVRTGYFFLDKVTPCLHPSLLLLAQELENARQYLVGAYDSAEEDMDVKFEIAKGIHREFVLCFGSIIHQLETEDVEVSP